MPSRDTQRNSPYGDLVGTEILASDPERGTIEVAYLADARFANRIGTVAGAMIAGLLDAVTGLVANLDLADGRVAVHTQLAVAYHLPATPGRLTGRGHVVAREDRDIRSCGELFDGEGKPVATATATLRVIREPSASQHRPAADSALG